MQQILTLYNAYLLYTTSTYTCNEYLLIEEYFYIHRALTLYNAYLYMQRVLSYATSTFPCNDYFYIQWILTLYNEYLIYTLRTYSIQRVLLHTTKIYSMQWVPIPYNEYFNTLYNEYLLHTMSTSFTQVLLHKWMFTLSSKHFQKYLLYTISTSSTQLVLILYNDTTNTTISNEYFHTQRLHLHTTSTNYMQRVLTRCIEYLLCETCTYSVQRVLTQFNFNSISIQIISHNKRTKSSKELVRTVNTR